MRTRGTAVLALMYSISFIVVCLATCFAADASPDHACCAGSDGFRAVVRDCCSVVPGLSERTQTVVTPAAIAVLMLRAALPVAPIDRFLSAPPAKAVSPPLVLRI